MRPLVVALLACACAASATPARGDSSSSDVQAHQAYERGTTAYRRKDYATAAREYAAADALSPNPTALQAALDAAVLADDPVLGMQLLDRARGTPRSDALLSTMMVAEKRFAARTGRVRFACSSAPCLATIDGAAVDPASATVVRVGSHSVLLQLGGRATTRVVTVGPDEIVVVEAATAGPQASQPVPPPATVPVPPSQAAATPQPVMPPPQPVDAPPPQSSGLSPVWFWAGAGATALTGGLAIASGVDTASKHSSFEQQCTSRPPGNCAQLSSAGQSAQERTNVLVGVTAFVGVATLACLPFVRWRSGAVSFAPGSVRFDARF
jgi:hypothetical protein